VLARAFGEGVLRYRRDEDEKFYRVVVDIDPGIADFYRWQVPKHLRLNRQKFLPHVTVAREREFPKPHMWQRNDGERILFAYDKTVQVDETYAWLDVYCVRLEEIRQELGLARIGIGARPPDGKNCFHTTLGNFKREV
jgi:hypothetical protein